MRSWLWKTYFCFLHIYLSICALTLKLHWSIETSQNAWRGYHSASDLLQFYKSYELSNSHDILVSNPSSEWRLQYVAVKCHWEGCVRIVEVVEVKVWSKITFAMKMGVTCQLNTILCSLCSLWTGALSTKQSVMICKAVQARAYWDKVGLYWRLHGIESGRNFQLIVHWCNVQWLHISTLWISWGDCSSQFHVASKQGSGIARACIWFRFGFQREPKFKMQVLIWTAILTWSQIWIWLDS